METLKMYTKFAKIVINNNKKVHESINFNPFSIYVGQLTHFSKSPKFMTIEGQIEFFKYQF